jgi:hypothetical protein
MPSRLGILFKCSPGLDCRAKALGLTAVSADGIGLVERAMPHLLTRLCEEARGRRKK